ncbi:MAG: Ig-like domain-containing protein [Clostridia bacterium]|nr:Ig-like domain-containing protein [Clostridia bacterium]
MKTVYGKLTALIFALTIGLLLFLPMRYGQEDHLYAYPHTIRMRKGDTYSIKYVLDSDHAQAISYTAVDDTVARVSRTGKITAIRPGATDIHLDASGGAKTTVHVTVVGTPTTEIRLNTSRVTIEKGEVTGLSASFNEGADDTLLEWRSEDESIATVDPTGRVTAHRGGRTKVYAVTPNGIRADADVLVHVSGDAMRITPEELTVGTGTALKMGTIYFPDDATETVERWITSDPNLLTVDADGTIHAVNVGKPVLSAITREGLATSAVINVERAAANFDLSPSAATLERGDTLELEARFLDAEGNPDPEAGSHYIEWQSSDPAVATVENGHVRAVKSGETVLSASADGMRAECALKVQVLVHEITLNQTEMYLLREDADKPIPLTATLRPADPDDPTVTWSTSNDLVANVDENGLVTMTGGYGTAVITARAASGAEARFTVSLVTQLPDPDAEPDEADAPADGDAPAPTEAPEDAFSFSDIGKSVEGEHSADELDYNGEKSATMGGGMEE